MNEKQSMELAQKIVKLMGPVLYRMNFDEDFEYWLRKEHIEVVADCKEELFDAVFNMFYECEDNEVARFDTFEKCFCNALKLSNNSFKKLFCECCGAEIIYKGEASLHKCADNGTVRLYCQQCYSENFVKCDHCGKEMHREECVSAIRNRLSKHYCNSCAGMLLSAEGDE